MTSYVMRNQKLVLKSTASRNAINHHPSVLPDIMPFVTVDGQQITSRAHLREYERSRGVKQVGNDFASSHKQLRERVHGEKAAWFKLPKS